ncbi:MAG: MerR family transcriptional regulator [Deltaproteobacteria bacterium]|nr:MerR family transcriptional regulator [Deltaproteobacteria bacterium]
MPDKLYFKIGEVAQLVGVQAHVLRYWQSEIAAIRPSKSVSNQRRYRYRDVEVFREIKRLLYDERYTLAGARRRIMSRQSLVSFEPDQNSNVEVENINLELQQTTPPTAINSQSDNAESNLRGNNIFIQTELSTSLGTGSPSKSANLANNQLNEKLISNLRYGLQSLIKLAGEEP